MWLAYRGAGIAGLRVMQDRGPAPRAALTRFGGPAQHRRRPASAVLAFFTSALSVSGSPMQLLVAVINQEEKLDEIVSGFLELGITGATIVNSEGMGRVLAHDIPIFAGLQTLIARSRPKNQTIFSVIDDESKVDGAIALLTEICGDLEDPATGIVFTVPVLRVKGLAPELGEDRP
jgi:hypothetical protein